MKCKKVKLDDICKIKDYVDRRSKKDRYARNKRGGCSPIFGVTGKGLLGNTVFAVCKIENL